MDRFAFFFGFYGLLLGLAVTELLNGLGSLARAGELKRLGAQSALLALLLLIVLCDTWIDAWASLRNVPLNFSGLWAPILLALLYYLAAAITFPKNPAEWRTLDEYFDKRKSLVASLMLAAEFTVNYSYSSVFTTDYYNDPHRFWYWDIPYNVAIKLVLLTLIFAKGRRANIAALSIAIILYFVPYWSRNATG